jgi:tetratricopeptide (TPR) repeat protein
MHMRCGIVSLLCSWVALAQPAQRDPIQSLINAYRTASSEGRFDEAAARRADARDLLKRVPPDAPDLAFWVSQVSMLYARAERTAEASALLEDAVVRAGNGPRATSLLNDLSSSWEQEGNLLRAVEYAEKAIAAAEAPETASPAEGAGQFVRLSRFDRLGFSNARLYQHLAQLYLRIGRKDDAAQVVARLQARTPNDPMVASLYEDLGRTDEAAALYRTLAEQAPDPQSRRRLLQGLSGFYERHLRWAEAAAAMQEAIVAVGALGSPVGGQDNWLRGSLAHCLENSGNLAAAEQAYQSTVTGGDPPWTALVDYTAFLGRHEQSARGEAMLNDYLDGHPYLNSSEQSQLLFSLSNLAQQAGANDRAGAYQERALHIVDRNSGPSPHRDLYTDAWNAVSRGDFSQGMSLALETLSDPQVYAIRAMEIVEALAAHNRPELANQLYGRIVASAESRSADSMRPLLDVLRQRANFLLQHQDWQQAEPVIDRYRGALAEAYGPGSGRALDALRMQIRLDEGRQLWPRAIVEAQDLLASQAALSGTVSEAYYRALVTAVGVYESSNNTEAALPLVRREVEVADQVLGAGERACVRTNAATAFARAGQFDEAERLAGEALALDKSPASEAQIAAIRRMKAGDTAVGGIGCGFGGSIGR